MCEERIPLTDDKDYLQVYMVWRARYQRARNIADRTYPKLYVYDKVLPWLFDHRTADGKARREEVLHLLDKGDWEAVADILRNYEDKYFEEQTRLRLARLTAPNTYSHRGKL